MVKKRKKIQASNNFIGGNPMLMKGQRKMARLVQGDRNATAVQIDHL